MLWKFCPTPKKQRIFEKFNPENLKYPTLNFHKKILDTIKAMASRLRSKIEHDRRVGEDRDRQEKEKEDTKKKMTKKELEKLQHKIESERKQRKILDDLKHLFLYRDFFK